jgi:eukaryotic-like serine/threonine-protein kinase
MISLTGNFGQYHFEEREGRINSGQKFNHVYKGINSKQEPVLIKRLLPALQHDTIAINRFRNEFDLRVQHPHIISATDYFIANGSHYLVRNWVNGRDLTHTLHNKSVQEAVAVCIDILHALEGMHAHHILHLDVQPRNIIIGTDKRVYLTDLGLARTIADNGQRQPFNIYYSAPEQILNKQQLVNVTTDLFAVGMILLELVNKAKFQGHENPEILMNLILASPLTNHKNIHEDLFAIIKKATAKPRFNLPPGHYSDEELNRMIMDSQTARFPGAQQFINDLQQLKPHVFPQRKWWKLWQ